MNRINKRREDLKSLEAFVISCQNWDLIGVKVVSYSTTICHIYNMRCVY